MVQIKEEIRHETERIFNEFMPILEGQVERARGRTSLLLCLTQEDIAPDYLPCEQAEKSLVSEIISVLQAEARIDGTIVPYTYESVAIISRGDERDDFARKIDKARELISKRDFGKTMPQKKISMSFGISSYPVDSEFPQELLIKARKALAVAAKKGNSVECFWKLENKSLFPDD